MHVSLRGKSFPPLHRTLPNLQSLNTSLRLGKINAQSSSHVLTHQTSLRVVLPQRAPPGGSAQVPGVHRMSVTSADEPCCCGARSSQCPHICLSQLLPLELNDSSVFITTMRTISAVASPLRWITPVRQGARRNFSSSRNFQATWGFIGLGCMGACTL